MTGIDLQTRTTHGDAGRTKSVLFCPVCGHESPVGGDWLVAGGDGHGRDVVCPNCDRVVASQ